MLFPGDKVRLNPDIEWATTFNRVIADRGSVLTVMYGNDAQGYMVAVGVYNLWDVPRKALVKDNDDTKFCLTKVEPVEVTQEMLIRHEIIVVMHNGEMGTASGIDFDAGVVYYGWGRYAYYTGDYKECDLFRKDYR
jgi:hypothetical protein